MPSPATRPNAEPPGHHQWSATRVKLSKDNDPGRRPLGVLFGLVLLAAGTTVFWFGFNSVLIGAAYLRHPAFWAPILAGILALLLGLWLLTQGARRTARSFQPDAVDDD
jgi:hypothetical protein